MRTVTRCLPLFAAAALGAAGVLAFAPFAMVPLAWLVAGGLYWLQLRAATVRAGFLLGLAFGLGYFLTGTSWVYVSMSVFGGMSPPLAAFATILFCAYLAVFPALAGALFVRLRRNRFFPDAACFAALWALSEWLRGWLFTGFPWLALGYSQTPPSPLAGFAPLLGVYGVSLAVALLGAAFAELLRRWFAVPCAGAGRLACGTAPMLTALALLMLGAGLGEQRWSEPHGAPLRVALLQGNVPQDLKWRPEKLGESLTIYGELMRAHPATLTVLPETAIPTFLDSLPRPTLETLLDHATAQRGDILFGIAVGDGERYANAAVSVGDSPTQLYAKSHLVPFGEFVPPGFQWFLDLMRIPMGNFMPGPDRQSPLEIAGQKVAVNICYEDLFGDEIIRALPAATLLVNLSNTAWFGDSLAQPQHLQIAQMRALETGRPMLRATNTGMTAVVLPDGTVQSVLAPFTRDALLAEVQGHAGTTPYVRWGNPSVLILALIVLAVVAFTRKSRQTQ
ncbi:MAG: apolipoprotein N-acyltransferase [Rhodocyclaceae bacterium]|nr:apolipoprotein N-acyltransferase [Rhodocyclaceae bacterium]